MNRFALRDFLRPIEQTALLCGMRYLPPFVAHGTHRMNDQDIGQHAADYRRVIEALRDERIDPDQVRDRARLNLDVDQLLGATAT
jgi:glutathione-regulated potassium-efflux system ancillary protein KefG